MSIIYRVFGDHEWLPEDQPADGLIARGSSGATPVRVILAPSAEEHGQVEHGRAVTAWKEIKEIQRELLLIVLEAMTRRTSVTLKTVHEPCPAFRISKSLKTITGAGERSGLLDVQYCLRLVK